MSRKTPLAPLQTSEQWASGDFRQRFSYNLRRRRLAIGISQEELGERTELHRTEISLLERAGREPRLATLLKLAGALETTPGALCAGAGWDYQTHGFRADEPKAD